jgi:ATP synthase mitochondrial F1 complex assembly factor 1
MATTCGAPALRCILAGRQLLPRSLPTGPASYQRRWAQVQDVRFLTTTRAARNVADRYRDKLATKARAEGHGDDVGSLKAAYADKIAEQRRSDHISVPWLDALLADEGAPSSSSSQKQPQEQSKTQTTEQQQQQQSSKPTSGDDDSSKSRAAVKPLSEILDLPKARTLPAKELGAIWRLRHAANPLSLCAAIPAGTYAAMAAAGRQHPMFVLPVPREGAGAEIHLLQWVFDEAGRRSAAAHTSTVLMTQLAEFQARGEWAQPHTSVTHYFDASIAHDQQTVLMGGSLVEGRGASVQDAQWLIMLMQRFYGGVEGDAAAKEKRRLLEEFTKGVNGTFSVEQLLEECEKLG